MAATVDRDKLLKLLAMLDSDQEGEVLAAVRKIAMVLRESGQSWDDLIAFPASKGWGEAFAFSTSYFLELKRRVTAERNAEHWQSIARAHQDELRRVKASLPEAAREPSAKPRRPVKRVTGHAVIDQLLAIRDIDPQRRARIEAIATWFRKTGMLTKAEETDLETFSRQLEGAAG